MLMQASEKLRRWLKTKDLEGYLRVADIEPHSHIENIVKNVNVDRIINKQVHRFLNMKKEGYDEIDLSKPTFCVFRRVFSIREGI